MLEDELQVYKTVIAMSGDIIYRYDIENDTITLYSGNTNMARYGTVIKNYSQMLHRQEEVSGQSGVRNFIHNLKHSDRGYFECEACLPGMSQNPKWYSIIGRTEYDDNNAPYAVLGKMTDIDIKRNILSSGRDGIDFTDKLTGILDKRGTKNRLASLCSKMNGEEGCFLTLLINGLEKDEDIVNVAQYIKRLFPFDTDYGRNKQNQFYIIYTGHDVNRAFLSKLEQIIPEIKKIVVSEVCISGGLYKGPFAVGEDYEIREKAHMAMMTAKLNNLEKINVYTNSMGQKEETNAMLSAEDEFADVEFDHALLERTLDIMYHSGNVDEAIEHIFRTVGKKFNIDRVVVCEADRNDGVVKSPYTWINDDVPYLKGMNLDGIIPDYDCFCEMVNHNDLIVSSDVEELNVAGHIKARMKTVGLKSIIHCTYSDNHYKIGSVGFENYGTRHKWTDKEIRTIKFITRLITVCLLNARSYEEMLLTKESYDTRDALTGLYKYESFIAEVNNYVKQHRGQLLAVMYTGMKNFLAVNSRFGYDAGDALLTKYANLMCQDDRFIMGCRVNADNYVFLVKAFDVRGNRVSSSTINRINEELFNRLEQDYNGVDISITAGISIMDDDEPVREHIKHAFEARGRAYNEGLDALVI